MRACEVPHKHEGQKNNILIGIKDHDVFAVSDPFRAYTVCTIPQVLDLSAHVGGTPPRPSNYPRAQKNRTLIAQRAVQYKAGDVLLSHPVTRAVPWALMSLTTVFGMGTGVTSSLMPPAKTCRLTPAATP